MPHALSSSRCRAHLPDTHTCIHCLPHHHVCVWALGCRGFTSRQAGLCLPRGMGRGSGKSKTLEHTSVPPPHRLLGPAHPHPCPPLQCQLPGLTECLGPAKDRTRGCILGLDSATPTHSRPDLAPTQCQSPALGKSSGVQPASLPHMLRPLMGQQCGDSAEQPRPREGLAGLFQRCFGFGGPCCGPQESSAFGSQAPSLFLTAGIALVLGLPVGQGAAAVGAVLCLTTSPSRHPGQRGQAGDGVHPRWLVHGGHGQHDRRQHPGQLWERDCHHPQLPRWSARYEPAGVGGAASTAGQWDNPCVWPGSEQPGRGWRGVMARRDRCGLCPCRPSWQPGGCHVAEPPAHSHSLVWVLAPAPPSPGSFTQTGSTESKYWFVVK